MNKIILFILVAIVVSFPIASANAQCGPGVPTLIVDLTGSPDSVWVSPSTARNDNCCGTTNPDKCVQFIITLDPLAVGVSFDIIAGAVPGGALFYQVGCGPPSALGSPICLSGVGPHIITFCKPGNNSNVYEITSIPGPTAGTDEAISDGCTGVLTASGYDPASVTWQSIFPGAPGAFNSYLSCTTGCLTTTVTPAAGAPAFVDYVVCGITLAPCITTPVCDTVRVYIYPTLTVSIIPINPTICFGATSINLTAVGGGGLPPYNFLWSTGATTSTVAVGAGTFSVVLGDATGCPPTSTSVTVTQFTNPITANAGADVQTCYTDPNITLNGSVTGVTTGIWSGGGGTFTPNATTLNATYIPTAAEIASGSVTLTLTTTGNGTCPGDFDAVTLSYLQFDGTISLTGNSVLCFGSSLGSSISVTTTGTGPYTYSWNTSPLSTTPTVNNVPPGTYTLTITDAIGCVLTGTTVVGQPLPLAVSSNPDPALCFGTSTGSAAVTVTGGTPGYTYAWSPTGGTGSSATGLAAGPYTCVITDANGCIINSNMIVTQPAVLTTSVSTTPVSCAGGSDGVVTATPAGGTAPYFYSWSPSGSTSASSTGLSIGTYTVTVTDVNGCVATNSITVTQPLALTVVTSSTNETCAPSNNGTGTAVASNGTAPYTYLWSPGGATTSTATGLATGSYSVVVTDDNGCQVTGFVSITEPLPLLVGFSSITPVDCFGTPTGAATSNVTGGTAPYSYSWSPSGGTGVSASALTVGTYTLTVTDANGCISTGIVSITQPSALLAASNTITNASCFGAVDGAVNGSASGGTAPYTYSWSPGGATGTSITGLAAGTYTLTVTDDNGCTDTDVTTVTQPTQIVLTMGSVDATCSTANGQASVSASGGTPGYTYSWSPTGGTGTTATGLLAGSYSVTVTDNIGCSVIGNINVNNNSGPVASIISTTNVSCFGGSDGTATVGFAGGLAPFTITWSPFGGTSATATGLTAGTYTATVTDGNGCMSLATTSPSITEPPLLVIATSFTDVTCNGANNGTATVTASGGTPGYTYLWTGGMTTAAVSGLAPGTYSVDVTDANSCLQTTNVTIVQPTVLTASVVTTSNVSCFGGNDGSGTVTGAGGTPGYTYSWSPFGGTTASAIGLSNGSYTVTVTDANGCTTPVVVAITQPTALSSSTTTTAVTCFGGNNGSATVLPSGGTPGYSFLWSPGGSTSATSTGLIAGVYTILLTDSEGCTLFNTATVTQPTAISLTTSTINSTCGSANGLASASVSGGTGPYTYLWTPSGGTGSIASSLLAGTYNVLVTDAQGCTQSASATVNNTAGPTLNVVSVTNASCFGGNNGAATIGVTGGTGPMSFFWTPSGGFSSTALSLVAGTYTLNVTDANGCFNSISVTITQPTPISITFPIIGNVSCTGGNDGSISALATGGTPGYSYSWSPTGGSGSTASSLTAGTYTLTVTDANGCTALNSTAVSEPSPLGITLINATDPTCTGGNNGSIEVIAGGGTAAYSYLWNTIPAQTGAIATGLVAGSYSVTAIDSKGCSDLLDATLINPSQVTTLAGIDDTICLGNNTVLSAVGAGGSGSYFYDWTPASTSTASSITVAPVVTSAYIVTAYDNNGCAGNTDTMKVVVYNLNGAAFDVYAYSPICPGISTTVYASIIGDQGPLTFAWNNGLGPGPGSFLVTPTVDPTYYICTVTNACGASVTDSAVVTFNPPPVMNISSDTMSGCMPLTVNFFDLSTTVPNDSIVSWNWDFGDGTPNSSLQNPVHIFANAGTYSVTLDVITWGGCVNNSAASPYIITVYPLPTADFSVSSYALNLPYDNLACINLSTGAVSYSWNFGDGSTSTSLNPIHNYANIGTYTITLTATNSFGCTDASTETVVATSEIIFPTAFTPDPNGSNGGAYDPMDLSNNVFFPYTLGVDTYRLLIFNRWGELIFESKDVYTGWDGYYRGTLCTQDVYVWKAEVTFIDGREFKQTGDLTLLR